MLARMGPPPCWRAVIKIPLQWSRIWDKPMNRGYTKTRTRMIMKFMMMTMWRWVVIAMMVIVNMMVIYISWWSVCHVFAYFVGKIILAGGKIILEGGKIISKGGKIILACGKIILVGQVGKLFRQVGKLFLQMGKLFCQVLSPPVNPIQSEPAKRANSSIMEHSFSQTGHHPTIQLGHAGRRLAQA